MVAIRFEFTPKGAAAWLGERRQPTQIDVYFQITRSDRQIGHLLFEVKFSESSFAGCRGWGAANPDRSRCLDVSAILSAPQANCWITEAEGRRYWEIMSRPDSSIRVEAIRSASGCPFRHGLYQMMRNRVLADELVRHTGADWADFAVCRHPGNKAAVTLDKPVSSTRNVIEAFRSLSSDHAGRDWNAAELLATIRSTDNELEDWESWMRARYFVS
ncbi:MAG: hypothetical protein ABSE69_20560 [Roseiarcus sp.]